MITTNASEFPYQLSLHAAGMLLRGLIRYAKETKKLFDESLEDGSYSVLRNSTNIKEAKRLREFLLSVSNNLVAHMLLDLKFLLEDLEETDKIYRDHEEKFPGKVKKRCKAD
jgi:hypothetical protein